MLRKAQALLLEGAADVCHACSHGRTALLEAAAGGHPAVVEALLDLGMANPSAACAGSGNHPLLEAARGSHVEAAHQLLAHGAKADLADNAGDTALLVAARFATFACNQAGLDGGVDAFEICVC